MLQQFFARPVAHGNGAATSWDNACSINHINALPGIPGSFVYLRADEGPISSGYGGITLNKPGASDSPITYMGVDVDLKPMKLQIRGQRPNWTLPDNPEQVTNVAGWANGGVGFHVMADYLKFCNFYIANKQAPFYMHTINYPTFEDIELYNVREGFFMNNTDSVIGLVLRRSKVTGWSKKVLRFFGNSENWLVEDLDWNSGRQSGDSFANGICGDKTLGTAHGLIVRGRVAGGLYNGVIKNCHDGHYLLTGEPDPSVYWNGDAIALEHNNSDILIQDLIASGCTDAGIDSKASNCRLVNVETEDNKRNLKMWGGPHFWTNCLIGKPHLRGGNGGPAFITALNADITEHGTRIIGSDGMPYPLYVSDTNYTNNIIRPS